MAILEAPGGGDTLRAASVQTQLRLEPGHGQPLGRHPTLLAEVDPGPPPAAWTDAQAHGLFAAHGRGDEDISPCPFLGESLLALTRSRHEEAVRVLEAHPD